MIEYEQTLNPAQYAAVTAGDGPVLVIAGAGSGKTRTIVYRLAWLAEQGVPPASMLLLTFTRKAAQEMLLRAGQLLGQGLHGVQGGTFHGFAYGILRQYPPLWLEGRPFSVMDAADITAAVRHCKTTLQLGKGDRSFPKSQTIVGLLSKARNKEIPLEEVLRREAYHLLVHAEALMQLQEAYTTYRKTQGLLDYDDLLFELEALLVRGELAAKAIRERYRHIMVDEYQDTNLVQARIVRLLGSKEYGGSGNVMAVGDDAQSIYAFRGADIRNIRSFPELFPDTRVVRLEENYRSTQPILDIANALLANAGAGFDKQLFTRREGGESVRLIKPINDKSQAQLVVRRVTELLQELPAYEIAVLFRAGFHSYQLEVALKHAGIAFCKYGGIRFVEAAHIKDVTSYIRLCLNPLDMPAFQRVAMLHSGIGPKTMQKLYDVAIKGDSKATEKAFARYPDFLADMRLLDTMRTQPAPPAEQVRLLVEHYQPYLEASYPDDWPRRRQGLDELIQMATSHTALDQFVADLALDSGEENVRDEDAIILSTVHSAKGLEWGAVILIDLVEDRFPSRHALTSSEDFEEERRLMYVACTRARKYLELYVPVSVYGRGDMGSQFATPSPFIRDMASSLYEDWTEGYGGVLHCREHGQGGDKPVGARLLPPPPASVFPSGAAMHTSPACDAAAVAGGATPHASDALQTTPLKLGYCTHKIFGRGKMIKFLPPDKYQVNFPGFGLKTILADFLTPEGDA